MTQEQKYMLWRGMAIAAVVIVLLVLLFAGAL
jgi:hypothetical protein